MDYSDYDDGFNEGLERAAVVCEYAAHLALRVRETDCTAEAGLYLARASEIRALKVKDRP